MTLTKDIPHMSDFSADDECFMRLSEGRAVQEIDIIFVIDFPVFQGGEKERTDKQKFAGRAPEDLELFLIVPAGIIDVVHVASAHRAYMAVRTFFSLFLHQHGCLKCIHFLSE